MGDEAATAGWPFDDPTATRYAVVLEGAVVGMVQYGEEEDPSYRHAWIDVFLDPAVSGRGHGRDAVRTLAHHLLRERGHHRLVIDPAADNAAAIRCYAAVGFRPVGVMRQYERDADGSGWHDGLLMDLLAADLDVPADVDAWGPAGSRPVEPSGRPRGPTRRHARIVFGVAAVVALLASPLTAVWGLVVGAALIGAALALAAVTGGQERRSADGAGGLTWASLLGVTGAGLVAGSLPYLVAGVLVAVLD